MKFLQFIFLLSLATHYSFLQGQNTSNLTGTKSTKANFVINIDINQATKDGIYLNGYVVNIPYDKLLKLNGKKVRIKGKVTIVKGLKDFTDDKIRQGRHEDTKHILNPKIKVIDS